MWTNHFKLLVSKVWFSEWVPLCKKSSGNDGANHRNISLIPIASKLLESFIIRGFFNKRQRHTHNKEAGPCSGRGYVDQTFTS